MTSRGPVIQAALDLLADGQWHSYEQIRQQLLSLVPLEQALHRAQQDRLNSADRAASVRVRQRSEQELWRFGARAVVRDALHTNSFRERSLLELSDEPIPTRRIRMRPAEQMSPPPARERMPLSQAALDLLADGEWHSYPAVHRQLMLLVPPGQALRRAERQRLDSARHQASAERIKQLTTGRLIEIGARGVVTAMLLTNTRNSRPTSRRNSPLEMTDAPIESRMIRLRPRPEPGQTPPA